MKVIMLLLVVLMGICFWALLKMDNERHQSAESSTGGVIVHGCGGAGWAKNYYHIYDMDDKLIGIIRPGANGRE